MIRPFKLRKASLSQSVGVALLLAGALYLSLRITAHFFNKEGNGIFTGFYQIIIFGFLTFTIYLFNVGYLVQMLSNRAPDRKSDLLPIFVTTMAVLAPIALHLFDTYEF